MASIRSHGVESKAGHPSPAPWIGGLNAEQAAAVSADPDGALLILAGAGSGKTTVLTRRAAYLCDPAFGGAGVLALTFTKDAALEMEARLRASGAWEKAAVPPRIGTFHAFAYALIRGEDFPGGESDGAAGKGTDAAANWARLGFARCPRLIGEEEIAAWISAGLERARAEGKARGESPSRIAEWIAEPFGNGLPDGEARNRFGDETGGRSDSGGIGGGGNGGRGNRAGGFDPGVNGGDEADADGSGIGMGADAQNGESEREEWRKRFRAHLLSRGLIGFGDMVALALRLLRGNAGVLAECRRRWPRILVDEFQDTSRDQLELVRQLAGEPARLFLVGDDDQAIYGFRGADPGNLRAAMGMFPSLSVLKLETNYRSSESIVAYANSVFRGKPAALRKRLRAGSSRGSAPVRTLVHADGAEQARWMIGEMERLRREEGLAWSDMAILYRLNSLEPYYRAALERLAGPEAAREVTLATVHAAKGLEYPAVFFAGLEDGIVPHRRAGASLPEECMEEERRIFYVGVTRAQRFLYLCACRRRVLRGKPVAARPSPFLRRGLAALPGAVAGALSALRGKAVAA